METNDDAAASTAPDDPAPKVDDGNTVMITGDKVLIKKKLRRRDSDYDETNKCSIPRNKNRTMSIDKTKNIFNLAIDDVKEEYTMARIISLIEQYETDWERFPNDEVGVATRSAEKLFFISD